MVFLSWLMKSWVPLCQTSKIGLSTVLEAVIFGFEQTVFLFLEGIPDTKTFNVWLCIVCHCFVGSPEIFAIMVMLMHSNYKFKFQRSCILELFPHFYSFKNSDLWSLLWYWHLNCPKCSSWSLDGFYEMNLFLVLLLQALHMPSFYLLTLNCFLCHLCYSWLVHIVQKNTAKQITYSDYHCLGGSVLCNNTMNSAFAWLLTTSELFLSCYQISIISAAHAIFVYGSSTQKLCWFVSIILWQSFLIGVCILLMEYSWIEILIQKFLTYHLAFFSFVDCEDYSNATLV
jgi:hypothetical protein